MDSTSSNPKKRKYISTIRVYWVLTIRVNYSNQRGGVLMIVMYKGYEWYKREYYVGFWMFRFVQV